MRPQDSPRGGAAWPAMVHAWRATVYAPVTAPPGQMLRGSMNESKKVAADCTSQLVIEHVPYEVTVH